jgi:hypothetical protein
MDALKLVEGPGYPVDNEPLRLLHAARAEAQFLFGDEVQSYIHTLIHHVAMLKASNSQIEASRHGAGDKSKDWSQIQLDAALAMDAARKEMPKLLEKYLKMTQALPVPFMSRLASILPFQRQRPGDGISKKPQKP